MSAMEPLLFLCHRIPYPPIKGDKIHTYHTLRHLARRYRVYLGTFIDDPADRAYTATVREWCADAHFAHINPRLRQLSSLRGLVTGEALSVSYYRDRGLRRWIDDVVSRHGIRKALAYSSSMAQHVLGRPGLKAVLDVADLDSAKWSRYADEHRWPLSALYRREGRRLLGFECRAVRRSAASLFATVDEAKLLLEHAPDVASKVFGIPNGVDAGFFAPSAARASPFRPDERALVFTGAMDYWPNVDAACWFATDVMPRILDVRPDARFYIVGMNPAPAVRVLAERNYVTVTGRVEDVRPYLQHAAVFVAPLRLARGIQNKVLEAMAIGRPVVATTQCLTGIQAVIGAEIEAASTAAEFAAKVGALAGSARAEAIGRAARDRVIADYDWDQLLAAYDAILDADAVGRLDLPGRRPRAAKPALALAG